MIGGTSFQAVSPAGLVIDRVISEADHLLVIAHPSASDGTCTACGERSSQIHSHYQRQLLELPSHGQSVRLQNLLWVRTFETIEERRQALLAFRETYDTNWLIERHGFMTPTALRQRQLQPVAEAG